MTNRHAAYKALGANPQQPPPSSLLRRCHRGAPTDSDGPGWSVEGHTTCAASVGLESAFRAPEAAAGWQTLQGTQVAICTLGAVAGPLSFLFFSSWSFFYKVLFQNWEAAISLLSIIVHSPSKWWRITWQRSQWCPPVRPPSRPGAAGRTTAEEVRAKTSGATGVLQRKSFGRYQLDESFSSS